MAKNLYLLICLLCITVCTSSAQQGSVRDKVKSVYDSQIGQRELTGKNDGVAVESYLKYVGLAKGNPWCAAYVCWSLGKAGVVNPRAGGCVYLMERGEIIYKSTTKFQKRPPIYGDVFFIYFAAKKRVAHTGFIDKWGDKMVKTVEGNTNEAGSREGDGVYAKVRIRSQIYAVANYIKNGS